MVKYYNKPKTGKILKQKRWHRSGAVFLIINILTTFLPFNLFANNGGPTAIEATSFEPIDATDMVNLATGDFTYVLPLLNVPSPEGGYPIALAYHAGIAMDQEASWTGLGWNLNAGAINRSVNGYPDDYNRSSLTEFFYDEGGKEVMHSLSLGYSSPEGMGSVGLNLSWGSNRSLGGSVSIGAGTGLDGGGSIGGNLTAGTDGVGMGLGVTTGGLSLGANISSNGAYGGDIGVGNNDAGFNVGMNSNGTVNLGVRSGTGNDNQAHLGVSLSSNSIGINAGITNLTGNNVNGGIGTGIQFALNNSIKMGDYTVSSSGFFIPVIVPTQIGIFSMSYGRQEFRYFLGEFHDNSVSGPLHFKTGYWRVNCTTSSPRTGCGGEVFESYEDAENFVEDFEEESDCRCSINQANFGDAFMDIYELPIDSDFIRNSKIENNNPSFPNYDNYNVQAQGLSGGMSSRLFENGVLFGLSGKENAEDYSLEHPLSGASASLNAETRFDNRPEFYFENEISSYSPVGDADFNNSLSNSEILDHFQNNVMKGGINRRANSTFVEYFKNEEIINGQAEIIKPEVDGFNRSLKPKDGIGAFKITAVDGKTYHYSLPVYNHETITRTFGVISSSPNEEQSYFEKRQLEPFATHWLLTAVTGPDYIDNNSNGILDKGDFGYWVSFDYGKWSDGYVWKAPYKKDYITDPEDNSVKTWIRGRKEIYYLDKVKTRTHSALFVKEERQDGNSDYWSYKSVVHAEYLDQNSGDFEERFSIPSQNLLRLKEILLVKNDSSLKNSGMNNSQPFEINYHTDISSDRRGFYPIGHSRGEPVEISMNLYENVLEDSDNLNSIHTNALKVISLDYNNNLSNGKSTLARVNFKGKGGRQLLPPYKFDYENDTSYNFDIDDRDAFGYLENNNSIWSLNQITTPQGGEIQVEYENHNIKPVVGSSFEFTTNGEEYSIEKLNSLNYKISSTNNLGIHIGDELQFKYDIYCTYEEPGNCGGPCGYEIFDCDYEKQAIVTSDLGNGEYQITIDAHNCPYPPDMSYCDSGGRERISAIYSQTDPINGLGGIRTSKITTTDGLNSYTAEYKYGENENGIGYISYLPFAPDIARELPYSAELPAPKVMYSEVSEQSSANGEPSPVRTIYKFNVLTEKSEDKIKFSDFYEIDIQKENFTNNSGKEVDISKYVIKDNLASLGQLLEVATYNREGQLINKTINNYYKPGTTPDSLGMTKEAYQSYKIVDYNDTSKKDKWLINSSARITYPNLIKSTKQIGNGFEYNTVFKNLDTITGKAKDLITESSAGDQIRFKSILAYEKYPAMGSKVLQPWTNPTISGKANMLNQVAANYSQVKDQNGDWKNLSVNFNTWIPQTYQYTYQIGQYPDQTDITEVKDVWRKHQNYIWNGDFDNQTGMYIGFNGQDDGFDWSPGQGVSQPSQWKKMQEVTKYNNFSKPLETEDVNENKVSRKLDVNQNNIYLTGDSAYDEIFYSGGEDALDEGDVKTDTDYVSRTNTRSHTGEYSIEVPANRTGFSVTPGSNKPYRVSVWVQKDNYENTRVINGADQINYSEAETVIAGDWVQLNFNVDLTSSSDSKIDLTTISGTAYFDDFRVYPLNASVNSYVYNEWDELTHILGSNNLASKFEYDDVGRLIREYKEVGDAGNLTGGFKLVKEHKYTYKGVVEIDDDGDGVIDPGEGYPDTSLTLEVDDSSFPEVKVTAQASGGSGNYEYRWAVGYDPAMTYGSWGSLNSTWASVYCPDGFVFFKCEIKDLVSGETVEEIGNYFTECPDDPNGQFPDEN
ncbi:hypothetical protein APR41_17640 [Salegentibacter salinarum]|uniref:Uncharacterized protein n=1 Tax=Salegentibacter salinarum TaxID=447422 RepID=A0A2N0TVG6_9FLAO|nr:hypothetical protein [Salegentibacter salinarum]PKD18733.1 hypothetical protein APR41_17640 [Salegentibacter salinarum]SKB98676.1 hypothetical protein SAMN05660903_03647 [Salegentibacter salinarum]